MAERIPEYTAPALGLQPSERGIDANQQAARRIGAFYGQAAEDVSQTGRRAASAIETAGNAAIQFEEHREISAGAKNFAELQDNLTQQWNETAKNADPNDPAVAQKFRENVLEPSLDKFANQGFITDGGQKFAQGHVAALRQHMFEKTSADMSTLAGEAAKVNTAETINKLSNTAFNDPSSRDFALKTLETSVGGIVGSSPNLTGTQAGAIHTEILEKGREAIVKAAAVGEINRTAKVPDWVSDPAYSKYVNGIELKQFQKAAEAQAKSNAYYDRQTELLKKQQADLAVAKGINDVFTNSVSVDPNNPNRVRIAPDAMQKVLDTVRQNPDAPSAASHARTAIDWLQHQQNEKPTATDPGTKTALYTGMFSPDKPTSDIDIYRAEVDGKLSRSDAQSLLQLNKALTDEPLRGPIYQDTMKAAHAALVVSVPGLPGKDITGEANYAKFVQNFIPDYLAKKRAGTLPANALDINDPSSLISQHMNNFHRTVQQRMSDYTALLGGVGGAVEAAPATGAQLPPMDKREKGKVYPTAAGNMRWTGTGWVKP